MKHQRPGYCALKVLLAEWPRANRTIADIQKMVGLAEPSAFHRAFQKWTGMRPADYRSAAIRRRVRPTALDLTHPAESD